jgi:transcriptional regulator with XRE-family HTH domain
MLDLYRNIKELRIANNMNQDELAKKVGYADKGMISRIENGKVDLSQSQIIKIAEALRVTPGQLMGYDANNRPAAKPISSIDMDRALDFYDRYEHASPEIRLAIEALLKKD